MELNDSHLGKKEYWDKVYITELDNFKNNKDDVGKVCYIYTAVRYHHPTSISFLIGHLQNFGWFSFTSLNF